MNIPFFLKRAGMLSTAALIAFAPIPSQAADEVLTLDYETNMSNSNAVTFTKFNGDVYFAEHDPVHGKELWKTDGTAAATVLLKDIRPGSASSSPNNLMVVDGVLYFTATTTTAGEELWKTDGTAGGTVMVKDIQPGSTGSLPRMLTTTNNILFFTAASGAGQRELWKSDGTADGTLQLNTVDDAVNAISIYNLTAVGTDIFFSASAPDFGDELWKTDGTPEGTVMVKDISPGTANSSPRYLTGFNGALYFRAMTADEGLELWKSDGTAAGTVLVKDIYAGLGSGSPRDLTVMDDAFYFAARDDIYGEELWKSDGTETGTVLVKDIYTGMGPSLPNHSSPQLLRAVGSTLFLFALDGSNGRRLWKSDGTETGTTMIANDFGAGTGSINPSYVKASDSHFYFTNSNSASFVQWRVDSNGSAIDLFGTIGVNGASSGLTPIGNELFFRASENPGDNLALWVTDATPGGTVELRNPQPRVETDGVWVNGEYYFAHYSELHGMELWASDGTPGGTRMVKDINTGTGSSTPTNYLAVGNRLFFSAFTDDTGHELWQTDGTTAGTGIVKDIHAGTNGSNPAPLATDGNTLYFSAQTVDEGVELWKSDGTEAGTVLVKDLVAGATSGQPANGVTLDGQLYFSTGSGLWVSDGTEAGTSLVTNLSRIVTITTHQDTLYLLGNKRDLWKSDGTAAGTVKVADVTSTMMRDPEFFSSDETLFFMVWSTGDPFGLWTTDGTTAGTIHLAELPPLDQQEFAILGNNLYFAAESDTAGLEAWKTDGTITGTELLKDIAAGAVGSSPETFVVAGDTLFFTATNESDSTEIWQSDGTTTGTAIVSLAPGTETVGPLLRAAGGDGNIFFDTYDNDGISALYVLPNNPPAFVGTPSVSGEPLVDSVLSVLAAADDPDVSNSVTLSYQWKADGNAITGADAIVWTLTQHESGKIVSVDITARDNLGATTTLSDIGALEIYEALELNDGDGTALPDSLTLEGGDSTTFTINGGEGSDYLVTAAPNANGVTGTVTNLGNEYRFDAPDSDAFAGDHSVTVRDVVTGGEWTMDVTVPLHIETTRQVLLGGVETGELIVSGAIAGSTFNFDVMLPAGDGVSPPVPDTDGDVATMDASAVAETDAANGNPAHAVFTPAAVNTTSEFSIVADNGTLLGKTGTLVAQAPVTYAGIVKGPAGEAIEATVTLQALDNAGNASDIENELDETWQATADAQGEFSLVAPAPEDADAADAQLIEVVADGYKALAPSVANCHSATPCELALEYETAAADPVLDPDGGTFTDEVEITITTTTVDAVLYYTLDGDDPSAGNGTEIASGDSILLTENATLKVIATKSGLADSAAVSADYVIEPASTGGGTAPPAGDSGGGGALSWLMLLALATRTLRPSQALRS